MVLKIIVVVAKIVYKNAACKIQDPCGSLVDEEFIEPGTINYIVDDSAVCLIKMSIRQIW